MASFPAQAESPADLLLSGVGLPKALASLALGTCASLARHAVEQYIARHVFGPPTDGMDGRPALAAFVSFIRQYTVDGDLPLAGSRNTAFKRGMRSPGSTTSGDPSAQYVGAGVGLVAARGVLGCVVLAVGAAGVILKRAKGNKPTSSSSSAVVEGDGVFLSCSSASSSTRGISASGSSSGSGGSDKKFFSSSENADKSEEEGEDYDPRRRPQGGGDGPPPPPPPPGPPGDPDFNEDDKFEDIRGVSFVPLLACFVAGALTKLGFWKKVKTQALLVDLPRKMNTEWIGSGGGNYSSKSGAILVNMMEKKSHDVEVILSPTSTTFNSSEDVMPASYESLLSDGPNLLSCSAHFLSNATTPSLAIAPEGTIVLHPVATIASQVEPTVSPGYVYKEEGLTSVEGLAVDRSPSSVTSTANMSSFSKLFAALGITLAASVPYVVACVISQREWWQVAAGDEEEKTDGKTRVNGIFTASQVVEAACGHDQGYDSSDGAGDSDFEDFHDVEVESEKGDDHDHIMAEVLTGTDGEHFMKESHIVEQDQELVVEEPDIEQLQGDDVEVFNVVKQDAHVAEKIEEIENLQEGAAAEAPTLIEQLQDRDTLVVHSQDTQVVDEQVQAPELVDQELVAKPDGYISEDQDAVLENIFHLAEQLAALDISEGQVTLQCEQGVAKEDEMVEGIQGLVERMEALHAEVDEELGDLLLEIDATNMDSLLLDDEGDWRDMEPGSFSAAENAVILEEEPEIDDLEEYGNLYVEDPDDAFVRYIDDTDDEERNMAQDYEIASSTSMQMTFGPQTSSTPPPTSNSPHGSSMNDAASRSNANPGFVTPPRSKLSGPITVPPIPRGRKQRLRLVKKVQADTSMVSSEGLSIHY